MSFAKKLLPRLPRKPSPYASEGSERSISTKSETSSPFSTPASAYLCQEQEIDSLREKIRTLQREIGVLHAQIRPLQETIKRTEGQLKGRDHAMEQLAGGIRQALVRYERQLQVLKEEQWQSFEGMGQDYDQIIFGLEQDLLKTVRGSDVTSHYDGGWF